MCISTPTDAVLILIHILYILPVLHITYDLVYPLFLILNITIQFTSHSLRSATTVSPVGAVRVTFLHHDSLNKLIIIVQLLYSYSDVPCIAVIDVWVWTLLYSYDYIHSILVASILVVKPSQIQSVVCLPIREYNSVGSIDQETKKLASVVNK